MRSSQLVPAALSLILLAAPAMAQQRIGVASGVNPSVTGSPPGGAVRSIVIGQEVVYNEHITTSANGQTQILFLDESAMTIGPNADLTIDRFVYDPNTGTGQLAMTATRGVLRYVGGRLSKQENAVTIRTNTATIGVRGGIVLIRAG
ncbi:MAG TPA: FecR domain-containing protein [Stellaceae bacterium]|nr:FecR domain-containing protein [Stellaceae bacterium]